MAIDLMTFILPLVLVLAIVYGALDLSKVFRNKAVNGIIAVVIAFVAVSNAGIASFLISVMPIAAMLFIVIFFFKFIKSLFSGSGGERDWTMLIILIGLAMVFMLSQGTQMVMDWLPSGFPVDENNFILIIGIVLIIVIFFVVYKSSK